MLQGAANYLNETLKSAKEQVSSAQTMASETAAAASHRAYDTVIHGKDRVLGAATSVKDTVMAHVPGGGGKASQAEAEASGKPSPAHIAETMQYHEVEQPFVKLNNGRLLPLLGLGTWRSTGDDGYLATKIALKAGYRHIDTARIYGNEKDVGRALREVFAEGHLSREDIHVTTKLWNSDHGRVEAALRESLSDLGLEYVDLYLMHWPVTEGSDTIDPPLSETWKQMQVLVDKNLVRSIGVSNFSPSKLDSLISSTGLVPAVNQVEMHVYFRQDELINYCRARGIHVSAYSPLGGDPSSSWGKKAETEGGAAEAPRRPIEDPAVVKIAHAHSTSPAAVLLRWIMQRGCSVIPKSKSPERIQGNLRQVMGLQLMEEEMTELSGFDYQHRFVNAGMFVGVDKAYESESQLWE